MNFRSSLRSSNDESKSIPNSPLSRAVLPLDSKYPYLAKLQEPNWAKDEDFFQCYNCNNTFSTFVRKHHCRICGLIYCSACSSKKILNQDKYVRVCECCFTIFNLKRDILTEKTLEDENEINSKEIEIAKTIYSLTEKPQNHPILFNQGIVEHCLNIISSVETEDALILLSTCIYLFLTQENIRFQINRSRLPILQTINLLLNSKISTVKINACSCIRLLSSALSSLYFEQEESIKRIFSSLILESQINVDPMLHDKLAQSLLSISLHEKFLQEGGLVSVIHFALSETPNLQEIAAEIFDHLSLANENHKILVEHGAILPILNLLYSPSLLAQRYAFNCLLKISGNKEYYALLGREGLVEACIYILKSSKKIDLLLPALMILERLVTCNENHVQMNNVTFVQTLKESGSSFLLNTTSFTSFLRFINNLISQEPFKKLLKENRFQTFLNEIYQQIDLSLFPIAQTLNQKFQ